MWSTWVYCVVHNTCTKHGKYIKTQYIGSTSIFSREKKFSHVKNYLGSWVRTSDQDGVSPSVGHSATSCEDSIKDPANDTAHTVLSILVHRRSHTNAVWWEMKDGTSRALAWASCQMKSTASLLHRPPVSRATTTSRHRPLRSSVYLFSLSTRACNRMAPSSSAALGWASPFLVRALRRVTSTANCAPPKHGKSCASTSIRLRSEVGTLTFVFFHSFDWCGSFLGVARVGTSHMESLLILAFARQHMKPASADGWWCLSSLGRAVNHVERRTTLVIQLCALQTPGIACLNWSRVRCFADAAPSTTTPVTDVPHVDTTLVTMERTFWICAAPWWDPSKRGWTLGLQTRSRPATPCVCLSSKVEVLRVGRDGFGHSRAPFGSPLPQQLCCLGWTLWWVTAHARHLHLSKLGSQPVNLRFQIGHCGNKWSLTNWHNLLQEAFETCLCQRNFAHIVLLIIPGVSQRNLSQTNFLVCNKNPFLGSCDFVISIWRATGNSSDCFCALTNANSNARFSSTSPSPRELNAACKRDTLVDASERTCSGVFLSRIMAGRCGGRGVDPLFAPPLKVWRCCAPWPRFWLWPGANGHCSVLGRRPRTICTHSNGATDHSLRGMLRRLTGMQIKQRQAWIEKASHQSCHWERIEILSDSIECNHPSKTLPAFCVPEVVRMEIGGA